MLKADGTGIDKQYFCRYNESGLEISVGESAVVIIYTKFTEKKDSMFETLNMEDKSFLVDEIYCEAYRVKDFEVPYHRHEQVEILCIRKGVFEVQYERTSYIANEGDIFVFSPNVNHTIRKVSGKTIYHTLIVDISVLNSRFIDDCENKYFIPMANGELCFEPCIRQDAQLIKLFKKIVKEKREAKYGWEIAIKGYLFELVMILLREYRKEDVPKELDGVGKKRKRELVEKALRIVENQYASEITASSVARLLNISPQYFSNIFKELTGKTFINFLNHTRIIESLAALNSRSYKMRDIAINFGFSDENYYSRIFKKIMYVSPRDYLRHHVR